METNSIERLLELIQSASGKPITLDGKIEIDSLEFLELVKDVENEFSIRIKDNEFIGLNTPQDFINCVQSHISRGILV